MLHPAQEAYVNEKLVTLRAERRLPLHEIASAANRAALGRVTAPPAPVAPANAPVPCERPRARRRRLLWGFGR